MRMELKLLHEEFLRHHLTFIQFDSAWYRSAIVVGQLGTQYSLRNVDENIHSYRCLYIRINNYYYKKV